MVERSPSPSMSRDRASVRGVGLAALLLAASQVISRGLGYGREVLLAHLVGAGTEADAYVAAFTVPDLLNYMLAGSAFSLAFIPLYTRRRARDGEDEANRFFGVVLGTVGVVAVVVTTILWLVADPLVALLFDRFDPSTHALTVRLMRIVLPAQVFFLVGGVIKATLLARGRFLAAALAPVLYNTAIIAGGIILAPSLGVEGFAWGVLVGACLGPLGAPLWDARGRVGWAAIRVRPWARSFREYLWLALPLMLGLSLLSVDDLYGRFFGGQVGAGVVAQLNYARKLMQLPVAIVGQSVATAALPALTQLWAEGKVEAMHTTLRETIQATLALGLLGAAGFLVFADQIPVVVYEHGRFTAEDSARVAWILRVLSFAVPAWVAQQVATRAFYARGDTWRPMVLSTLVTVGIVPLYIWAAGNWGAIGIAGAGVIGMTVNAGGTVILARILHGGPSLGPLVLTGLRTLPALGLGGLAARGTLWGLEAAPLELKRFPEAVLGLALGGSLFLGVAGVVLWWTGDEPTRRSMSRVIRRLPGARRWIRE